MTELLVNAAELSINAVKFWFFKRLLFLSHVKHDSTKFYWISPNFLKIDRINHLRIFFAPREFSNTAMKNDFVMWYHYYSSIISWPARLGSVLPWCRQNLGYGSPPPTVPWSQHSPKAARRNRLQGLSLIKGVRKAGAVTTTSAAINGLAVDGKRWIDACWLTPDSLAITCDLYIPLPARDFGAADFFETGNWWTRCFACIMCQRRCWVFWSWHGTHCRTDEWFTILLLLVFPWLGSRIICVAWGILDST
jgi:hypothetical protein